MGISYKPPGRRRTHGLARTMKPAAFTKHLRRVCALVCCAVLLGLASRAAAELPSDLKGRPVVEVRLAGPGSSLASSSQTGITLGAPLSRGLVRQAIQRLLRSHRWADIQVDAVALQHGARLIFHLTPRLVLQRVAFLGNDALDDEVLAREMQIGGGSEVSRPALDALRQRLRDSYAERGYLDARARMQLRDTDDPATKVLRVLITEGEPTRIAEVTVEGPEIPYDVRLYDALELEPGDRLDSDELSEAVERGNRRLREAGYLEAKLGSPTVNVHRAKAHISIPASLGPRYRVALEGYQPVPREDVRDALKLGEERLTPALLSTMRERLLDLYRRHGFHRVKAEVTREVGPKGETAVLRAQLQPGLQVRVVALRFPGAEHFDREHLGDQIHSFLEDELPGSIFLSPVDSEVVDGMLVEEDDARRQVPPPLTVNPRNVYYEPIYEKAVKHITELYAADGFLSARVGPPRPVKIDAQRVAVVIPVKEGPRTRLHRVAVEGNHVVSTRELLTQTELERGQPFSHLALEEARLSMLELYRERGHLYARVEPSVRFSRDRTRAEVRVQVVERFPVYVERVIVRGRRNTDESLIRELVELQPGDLYRPSVARKSEEQLLGLGVFSGVTVAPADPDLAAKVKPIVVTVTERPGQYLDFSAGVSTGQGLRSGFEYGYRNLFGRALGLSLRVQFAHQFFFVDNVLRERFVDLSLADRLERRVNLSITVPHISFLPGVRTSIDLVHLRDNERDFGYDKNGVGITFTHAISQHLTVSLSEDLENNNVDLFVGEELQDFLGTVTNQRLRELLRVPEGDSTLIATRGSASLDFRDHAFVPTRGIYLSGSAEWARTLSTETVQDPDMRTEFFSHFVKLSGTLSGYVPLAEDLVLAAQLRGGRILHLTDASKTYPNRAFFLGGVDTLRGFFQDAVVPQDLADEIMASHRDDDPENDIDPNGVVRAGDTFILTRMELRFPIVGQLHGGLFTDVGNLWTDPSRVDPLRLRATAGAGLRLATPVGPLALDWGFILNRRENLREPVGTLHFSIGVF